MGQKTNIVRLLIVGLLIALFTSCAPHVVTNIHKKYPALDNSTKIKIIKVGESILFAYEELGSIKLGDAGMTGKSKCTYEALLALAIKEAQKVGGNAIKIVEHTLPRVERFGLGVAYYQCHSLFVLVLKTDEVFE